MLFIYFVNKIDALGKNVQLEAPSLAQLKLMLTPRTKIVGYYPNGYNVKPDFPPGPSKRIPVIGLRPSAFVIGSPPAQKPAPVVEAVVEQPPVKEKREHAKPKKYLPNPSKQKFDRNAIMTLLVEGFSAPEIARKVGIGRWQTVSNIVCEQRRAKDPRAIRRAPKYIHPRSSTIRV